VIAQGRLPTSARRRPRPSSRHRSRGSPRQNIIDGIDDVAALHFEILAIK